MSLRHLWFRSVRTAGLLFAAAAVWNPLYLKAQDKEDCLVCHSEKSLTMERKGKSVSLFVDGAHFDQSAHADLGCVSCHEGFKADQLPHAKRIKPVDCGSCHADEKFTNYQQSVHGALKKGKPAASCTDCHTTHSIRKLSEMPLSEKKAFTEQICATCHTSVATKYIASDHGKALAAAIKGAPTCIDCHGEHEVVAPTSEDAKTSRKQEARMCLSCHLDDEEVRKRVGPSAGFIASYENSVHGQAVQHGNEGAATCSDCHGSHEMKKGSDPDSKVSKKHIAETCGQCHGDIQAQFDESIHAKALMRGITASATCTDCHGEHNILSPKDSRSPVAPRNVSSQVCTPCHASLKLTEKYGLAANRFKSFTDSYHGLASRGGSVEVANCASCHGVHDIKPSTDSTSLIHPSNLVNTCGSCHPGANENFTRGRVHVIATSGEDAILYYIATGYIALIILTIGGMFVHNALDFVKKSKRQLMYRRGLLEREHHSNKLYLRMSLNERIQHATLAISFMILVVTGFALRYPDAWWVVPVRDISPWMFELRSLLHRIAGVVLVLVSLYHVYYVLAVPRGKRLLQDLLPVRQDILDVVAMMKYYLRFSEEKPKFGRFSYIEKAEYWALIWGTVVMAVTGVILWFDNTFMGLFTKMGWDIARTIHFYEAWLATLAIIVWHFYFVIFNPDSYPLNLAFWKGTLTEEEMAEEHPLELAEIKKREAAELAERAKQEKEQQQTTA
ncbi:MAG: cytochrome b/b6 domain-containing protein [Bacteroidetes bacterium]|nr:cytochrome b/b6 domain-containing protein [Bacteroidota bacterium]MCW5895538.1 cytochrome b/b6 domain-containing protein [Bacteroidota bacterium]